MAGLFDNLIPTFGDSSQSVELTPEALALRRQIALNMLQQGQAATPISSPLQGVNRVLQSMIGAYKLRKLDESDKASQAAANKLLIDTLGGNSSGLTTPSASGSSSGGGGSIGTNAGTAPAASSTSASVKMASLGPAPSSINPEDTIGFVKQEEGFSPVSKWDVRQYSGGYGSKAQPGETFDRAKAETYLKRDLQPSFDWINANVPNATPGQRTALASFGYNLGTGRLNELLPDIQAGNWQRVAERMQSFNKAATGPNGELEPSENLTERRKREAALVLGGGSSPGVGAPNETTSAAASTATTPYIPDSGAAKLQRQAIVLMSNPRTAKLGQGLLLKAATAEAPKQPEAVQEYMLGVKQGFPGTFQEWQVQMKQASRPQNIVSVSGEKKGAEKMAEFMANRYSTIQKNADGAQAILDNADALETALNGLPTGPAGDWIQTARRIGAQIGIENPDKVGSGDLVQAITNKMALQIRAPGGDSGGMPGAMSDADREFLKQTVPGLLKTEEGNRQLIALMRAGARRNIDIANLAIDYAQNHGGQLDVGFDREMRDYVHQHPLSKAIKAESAPSGAQAVEGAPAQAEAQPSAPAAQPSPKVGDKFGADMLKGLPNGAVVTGSDGKDYRVQNGQLVPVGAGQ